MSRNHERLDWRRWQATRKAAFERDSYRCTRCGKAGRLEASSRLHAHHQQRLADAGDPYDLANIVSLCREHHIAEHRRPLTPGEQEWADFVDDLAGR